MKQFLIYFISITLFFLILNYLNNTFIYTDKFLITEFSSKLPIEQANEFINIRNRYDFLAYLIIPFFVIFRVFFSAILIKIGFILSSIEMKFSSLLEKTLKADIVFLVASIVHSINMYLNLDVLNLNGLLNYYPLSAISIIGVENINAQWAIYPLQTLNIFELLYMIVIAWFLSRMSKENFANMFAIVLPSYGLGLLLWITLVAFLTFQVT